MFKSNLEMGRTVAVAASKKRYRTFGQTHALGHDLVFEAQLQPDLDQPLRIDLHVTNEGQLVEPFTTLTTCMAICCARGSRSKIRKLWNHTPREIAISNAIDAAQRDSPAVARRHAGSGSGSGTVSVTPTCCQSGTRAVSTFACGAVSTFACGEPRGTLTRLAGADRRQPELGLVGQRVAGVERPLVDGGSAIAAQTRLWERCQLVRKIDRRGERGARSDDAVDEADAVRLVGTDASTGEDQVHRPAVAHQAG